MNITVKKGNLAEAKTQAIILALCEDEKALSNVVSAVDQKTGGLIRDVLKSGDFEAKPSEISVLYTKALPHAKRIVLVGLGKKKELTLEKIRKAYAKVKGIVAFVYKF